MNDNHPEDNELNVLLRNRHVEAPSPDLAARIIQAAQRGQGRRIIGWMDVIHDFFTPAPAFALAVSVVIGVFIGYAGLVGGADSASTGVYLGELLFSGEILL